MTEHFSKPETSNVTNLNVLVLNENYELLNICRVRRAVLLLYQGKAEMLENGLGYIRSANQNLPIPSVIRLAYMVKRPYFVRRMTRFEVFNRDDFTCQYCGKVTRQLTVDHVFPRYRGGQHIWENVVSACMICNRRKAGKTPDEAGMKLIKNPSIPSTITPLQIPNHYVSKQTSWHKYIFH
jgi:5-methylcytosine-specific restriction endonuclease McrA